MRAAKFEDRDGAKQAISGLKTLVVFDTKSIHRLLNQEMINGLAWLFCLDFKDFVAMVTQGPRHIVKRFA
jgi:hypothetical protein